jgi:hypothetical protein
MDVCVCNDGTSEVKGLLAGPVNGSPYFAALSSITGSSNIINTTLNPGSICQNLTSHRRKPSALLFTYFSSQDQLRIPEWTDWWTIEDTQPHAAKISTGSHVRPDRPFPCIGLNYMFLIHSSHWMIVLSRAASNARAGVWAE